MSVKTNQGAGTAAPSLHLKNVPVTVSQGISKRSHEKIGNCEQSKQNILKQTFAINFDLGHLF